MYKDSCEATRHHGGAHLLIHSTERQQQERQRKTLLLFLLSCFFSQTWSFFLSRYLCLYIRKVLSVLLLNSLVLLFAEPPFLSRASLLFLAPLLSPVGICCKRTFLSLSISSQDLYPLFALLSPPLNPSSSFSLFLSLSLLVSVCLALPPVLTTSSHPRNQKPRPPFSFYPSISSTPCCSSSLSLSSLVWLSFTSFLFLFSPQP